MSGYWDRRAKSYNFATVKLFGNANRAIAVKSKGFCSPDSRILDIGCGTGLIISELAQIVNSVTAIDSSPAMIAEAKRLNDNKNIEWRVGDFYSRSINCGEYDIITAFNLLNYLDNSKKLVEDVYSVLPSGGYFISVCDCIGNMPLLTRAAYRLGGGLGLLPKTAIFKPQQLSEMMRSVGFEIAEERIVFNRTQKFFIAARKPLK